VERGFGVAGDQEMLKTLRMLGESLGAIERFPLLKLKMILKIRDGYSDKMRLEDMMEVCNFVRTPDTCASLVRYSALESLELLHL